VESTYLLHASTGQPALRAQGAAILRVINATRVRCGFAGIKDVTTGAPLGPLLTVGRGRGTYLGARGGGGGGG
jgi:hypothetical protein